MTARARTHTPKNPRRSSPTCCHHTAADRRVQQVRLAVTQAVARQERCAVVQAQHARCCSELAGGVWVDGGAAAMQDGTQRQQDTSSHAKR